LAVESFAGLFVALISRLHTRSIPGEIFRDGVVLHQEIAQLVALGDEKIDGLVELAAGEIDGPDEILRAGGHVQVCALAVEWEEMELPGLAAIQEAEAIGVDALLVEIDDARHADVLLNPRILDGFGLDAEQTLGEVAEGAMGHFLDLEDVIDLCFGQHALLDEQLSDLNAWQRNPP
jgi:hypothetical protein